MSGVRAGGVPGSGARPAGRRAAGRDRIDLGNEFSQVVVERVSTRNGARLRISVPASGREILLCPLELEALTWARPEVFSRLLATPHGPEDGADDHGAVDDGVAEHGVAEHGVAEHGA